MYKRRLQFGRRKGPLSVTPDSILLLLLTNSSSIMRQKIVAIKINNAYITLLGARRVMPSLQSLQDIYSYDINEWQELRQEGEVAV
jgi:hypothetical protein